MLKELGKYIPFGKKSIETNSHLVQESQTDSVLDYSKINFGASSNVTTNSNVPQFHKLFSISDTFTMNIGTGLDERKNENIGKLQENPAMNLEQEVYVEGSTVIWSRAGYILKTFDYSGEEQMIQQVLFAWFPVNSLTDPTNKPAIDVDSNDLEGDDRIVDDYWQKKGPQSIINYNSSGTIIHDKIPFVKGNQLQKRTLCIVFQDCIEIHCENGLNITSQIPFEIGDVVSLDVGLLVSRKHQVEIKNNRHKKNTKASSFFVTITHPLRGVCPVKTKEVSHNGINTLPEQFTSPQKLLFATTKSSESGRLPVIVTLNIKESKHYIWTYDRRKDKNQLLKIPQLNSATIHNKKRKFSTSNFIKKLTKSSIISPNKSKKSKLNNTHTHAHARFHEDYISDDDLLHENEVDRNMYHELLDSSEIALRLLWRESHGPKFSTKLKGVKDVQSKSFLIHDLNGQELICILNNTLNSLQVINLSKATQLLNNCIEFKAMATSAIPINATRDCYSDLLFINHTGSLELLIDKGVQIKIHLPNNEKTKLSLIDSVYDRFTTLLDNGDMFRYQLKLRPKTSLVRDCLSGVNCSTIYFTHIWCRFLKITYLNSIEKNSNYFDITEWETLFITLLTFLPLKKSGYYTGSKKLMNSTTAIKEIQLQQIQASNLEYIKHNLDFFHTLPNTNFNYLLDQNYIQGVPIKWIDQIIKFQPKDYMEQDLKLDMFEFTEIVKSLHIVYEDYRINKTRRIQANLLGYLLLQSSVILRNKEWITYYSDHQLNPLFTGDLKFIDNEQKEFFIEPPNIQICLRQMTPNTSSNPTLLSSFGVNTLDPSLGHCINTYALTIKYLWSLYGAINTGVKSVVLNRMVLDHITRSDIEILTDSVALPILEVLDYLKLNPMLNWPNEAYTVIGRNDIYKQLQLKSITCDPNTETFKLPFLKESIHSQNLNDLIKNCTTTDINTCIYKSDILNMETERLRFGFGGVIEKVRIMLDGSRVPELFIEERPDIPDEEIAAEHQSQVILLVQRTLSLGIGRAMYGYGTHSPDLTKALPIEPIVLSAKILPLRTVVSIDETMWNSDFLHWPEFHNGVAAGLRISPTNNVNDSWIDFCYPEELQPQHGGLLLALGLNGTLKKLSLVDWFRFITQPCDMVSVGFLLGAAVAFRGTMDIKLTKLISVHIPALLPAGSHSFNHSNSVQATSLLGIGLIYMNSCNRLMAITMLKEIEKNSYPSNSYLLKPGFEGCALAAGFSLGLITLGVGDKALRLDSQFRNKLTSLITGRSAISFNTNPYKGSRSTQNIDLDVTSAGATIALGLMYLRTENLRVAQSIPILETRPYLDYVRPDFLLIRVVARSLIMWSTILPSDEWIQSQLPDFLLEDMENSEQSAVDKEVSKQAMYNIIAGACLSIGLRFAGSKNENALECLIKQLDTFGRMLSTQVFTPQQHITKAAIRTCVGVLCTAAAMVMAGTGNQTLLTRLEILNERISQDMDYGNHMAVSMSLGMLFVGLGGYTLTTTNEAIAGLLCAFYPFYPMSTEDNQDHLQAFRHLWVLAVDSRWLMPFDVDNEKPCRVPMRLEIYEDDGGSTLQRKVRHVRIEAPTVVPDYKLIKSIQLDSDRYWPLNIQMGVGEYQSSIIKSGLIYVKRKPGKKSYEQDPFGRSITW